MSKIFMIKSMRFIADIIHNLPEKSISHQQKSGLISPLSMIPENF